MTRAESPTQAWLDFVLGNVITGVVLVLVVQRYALNSGDYAQISREAE